MLLSTKHIIHDNEEIVNNNFKKICGKNYSEKRLKNAMPCGTLFTIWGILGLSRETGIGKPEKRKKKKGRQVRE